MNRRLLCAAALLVAFAAASAWAATPRGRRTPGVPTRQGHITSIEDRGAGVILVKIALDSASTEGVVAIGGGPMKVSIGLSARLDFNIMTSFFRMPIGRVIEAPPDDKSCVVQVDQTLLEQSVEDPSTQRSHKVKEFFAVGAEVSLSTEAGF